MTTEYAISISHISTHGPLSNGLTQTLAAFQSRMAAVVNTGVSKTVTDAQD